MQDLLTTTGTSDHIRNLKIGNMKKIRTSPRSKKSIWIRRIRNIVIGIIIFIILIIGATSLFVYYKGNRLIKDYLTTTVAKSSKGLYHLEMKSLNLNIITGRVNINELFRIVFKEMRVGLILGICYGILLGVVTYLGFAEPKSLGLVVGLSIFFSMVMAATVGTLIPLVLKRFDVDAAVATGPVVTTSIDFLGVLMYLSVAKLLLSL